jgi:hypothetical protein
LASSSTETRDALRAEGATKAEAVDSARARIVSFMMAW